MAKEIKLLFENDLENSKKEGHLLFIGNATMLIRYGGLTILTDPSFIHMHEKVNLGYGLKSVRLTNPDIDIKELLT